MTTQPWTRIVRYDPVDEQMMIDGDEIFADVRGGMGHLAAEVVTRANADQQTIAALVAALEAVANVAPNDEGGIDVPPEVVAQIDAALEAARGKA